MHHQQWQRRQCQPTRCSCRPSLRLSFRVAYVTVDFNVRQTLLFFLRVCALFAFVPQNTIDIEINTNIILSMLLCCRWLKCSTASFSLFSASWLFALLISGSCLRCGLHICFLRMSTQHWLKCPAGRRVRDVKLLLGSPILKPHSLPERC